MKTKKHWSDRLVKAGACSEAVEWVKTQPSASVAWEACQRPDWMFWILGQASRVTGKRIAKVACAIARTSLVHVPAGELRPLQAIETAERFLEGKATADELSAAWSAARSAAWSAAWSAASSAASSAARSAAWSAARSAASSAAESAASSAASSAAWSAASSAAWSAASSAARRHQCDLIRAEFPRAPRLKAAR